MMSSPKPTLGYPTRTAAALALRAEGHPDHVIAEKVGISRNALSGLLSQREKRARDGYPARPSRPAAEHCATPTDETTKARLDGIMLATKAGQIAHRCTELPASRLVELRLSDTDFARLIRAARADGQTPAETARIFVQAGLALRGV